MGAPFKTIQTQDQELNRIQANIADAFNQLSGPFIGGTLLKSVAVGTSATRISTGLGRVPQVWAVCGQDTNTNVWSTASDANSITLIAGSACTISLWVN